MYIVPSCFKSLPLLPHQSFYIFPLILSCFLFDFLPVTTEANPTDVSKATGVKLAITHLIVWDFFGSNRELFFFFAPSVKRAPWENFPFLKWWEKYKVLMPWRMFAVCVHQKKKISNLQALSDWQLMALRQTFTDLSVSRAFLCACVCPHISNQPCFWLWSISISVLSWSHAPHPPPPQHKISSLLPIFNIIFWSAAAAAAASEQPATAHGGERGGVWGSGEWGEQLHGSVTHDKCFSSDPFSVKNH